MSRTLTRPDNAKGLLVYANSKGATTKFAARHIVSYTTLPNNNLSLITTGGAQILSFSGSTALSNAVTILDIVLGE